MNNKKLRNFSIVLIFLFIIFIFYTKKSKDKPKQINYAEPSLDYSDRILIEERKKFDSLNEFSKRLTIKKFNVDCMSIFTRNDSIAIQKAKLYSDELKNFDPNYRIKLNSDENFIFDRSMCEDYKIIRNYNLIDTYNEKIEIDFPIAYAILVYHHVEQIDRLLKLIWRPQNVYCFHIDPDSSSLFKKAIQSIANCFTNVFITKRFSKKIVWGSFSILRAELNCMRDLLKTNVNWKYLIHMSGDEFPLKTNYELVKILSLYNGTNDIDINSGLPFASRTIYKYKVKNGKMFKTKNIKDKPPHGYKIMKGHTDAALTRDFVHYICTDPRVKDLIKWSKDMRIPDEM